MARRTKIVCTLGPAVDDEAALRGLLSAGMDVARFNFSHGSHDEHRARMDLLKRVRRDLGSPCAILLDTRGPEIRTGALAGGRPVELREGGSLVLTERVVDGTAQLVSQTCAGLARVVGLGQPILLDDGLIELRVEAVEGSDIRCTVRNSGLLGERKSVNIPGASVPLPVMTDQDRADLVFGIDQDVDFVAASFVRNAEGVRELRRFLDEHGGEGVCLIAKIECAEAVENFEGIIEAADGVMVARGDLGVEVPAHKVPHIQKEIIRASNRASKPVITATQMLDSMIRNPRPTRAEVGDVANAIYDGTDAVMLSGETAGGRYPVEAVRMMARIAESSEPYLFDERAPDRSRDKARVALAVGLAAVQTAENVGAACIVAPTMSGRTARLVSNLRPRVPHPRGHAVSARHAPAAAQLGRDAHARRCAGRHAPRRRAGARRRAGERARATGRPRGVHGGRSLHESHHRRAGRRRGGRHQRDVRRADTSRRRRRRAIGRGGRCRPYAADNGR